MAFAVVALARHEVCLTLKFHICVPDHFKRCPCKRCKQTNTNIKWKRKRTLQATKHMTCLMDTCLERRKEGQSLQQCSEAVLSLALITVKQRQTLRAHNLMYVLWVSLIFFLIIICDLYLLRMSKYYPVHLTVYSHQLLFISAIHNLCSVAVVLLDFSL